MKVVIKKLMRFVKGGFGVVQGLSQEQRQAILELMSYSDRELADLGICRGSIIDAVRFGRPMRKTSQA